MYSDDSKKFTGNLGVTFNANSIMAKQSKNNPCENANHIATGFRKCCAATFFYLAEDLQMAWLSVREWQWKGCGECRDIGNTLTRVTRAQYACWSPLRRGHLHMRKPSTHAAERRTNSFPTEMLMPSRRAGGRALESPNQSWKHARAFASIRSILKVAARGHVFGLAHLLNFFLPANVARRITAKW